MEVCRKRMKKIMVIVYALLFGNIIYEIIK